MPDGEFKSTITDGKSISGVLEDLGYECSVDREGNLTGLSMKDESLTMNDESFSDEGFFRALAPAVESGSYITCIPEEGTAWRWYFQNGEVIRQKGHYVWVNETASFPSFTRDELEAISFLLKHRSEEVSNNSALISPSMIDSEDCRALNTTKEVISDAISSEFASGAKMIARLSEKLAPAINGTADAILVTNTSLCE